MSIKDYEAIAEEMEKYIEERLFDPFGIMYSFIDSHTGKPFDPEFITPRKVPRRAAFNPWAYWSYEDSIMTTGFYINGLVNKYEVTGNSEILKRIQKLWQVVQNIYSCSQTFGIGAFIRPYGGYDVMGQFAEPLGTDQAFPLFNGLLQYREYADEKTKVDIDRVYLQTLTWYADQGFQYFYYKSFIHSWDPDKPFSEHATGYYLPACLQALKLTGDKKWEAPVKKGLELIKNGRFNLAAAAGGSIITLKNILGNEFEKHFAADVMKKAYDYCRKLIDAYDHIDGKLLRFQNAEAKKPDFKPYIIPEKDPDNPANICNNKLGFALSATRHTGRSLPRGELGVLINLAGVGYNPEIIIPEAEKLLPQRTVIPDDFMHFIAEDYNKIPETTHLRARSIGVILVQWWQDFWMLRNIMSKYKKS